MNDSAGLGRAEFLALDVDSCTEDELVEALQWAIRNAPGDLAQADEEVARVLIAIALRFAALGLFDHAVMAKDVLSRWSNEPLPEALQECFRDSTSLDLDEGVPLASESGIDLLGDSDRIALSGPAASSEEDEDFGGFSLSLDPADKDSSSEFELTLDDSDSAEPADDASYDEFELTLDEETMQWDDMQDASSRENVDIGFLDAADEAADEAVDDELGSQVVALEDFDDAYEDSESVAPGDEPDGLAGAFSMDAEFDLDEEPAPTASAPSRGSWRSAPREKLPARSKSASRDKATPITDFVQFSVTAPACMKPSNCYVINLWAHLAHQFQEVLERAEKIHQKTGFGVHSKVGVKVARGTRLAVRLHLIGLSVASPEDTLVWEGEVANADFLVTVPADAEHRSYPGVVEIHAEGVPLAKVQFTVEVGEQESKEVRRSQPASVYRSAFVSYASKDRDAVLGRLQGIRKVLPDLDIFLDVASLRSGERWEDRLREEISQRDVLYLFWSEEASKSKYVDFEWRTALREKGVQAIDPVPLVSPEVVAPPRELGEHLHFNDWMLAYLRSTGAPPAPRRRRPGRAALVAGCVALVVLLGIAAVAWPGGSHDADGAAGLAESRALASADDAPRDRDKLEMLPPPTAPSDGGWREVAAATVGDLASYRRWLARASQQSPDAARQQNLQQALAEDAPLLELTTRWQALLDRLAATDLSGLSPAEARVLHSDAAELLNQAAGLSHTEQVRERLPWLAAIGEREDAAGKPLKADLAAWLQSPPLYTPLVLTTVRGERYHLASPPARQGEDFTFSYIIDGQLATKAGRLPRGEMDARQSGPSALPTLARSLLGTLATVTDRTWEASFYRMLAETHRASIDPLLKAQLLGRLLETGARGSHPLAAEFQEHRAALAPLASSAANWLDPDDPQGKTARSSALAALSGLSDLSAAAARVAEQLRGSQFPAFSAEYAWAGVLVRDAQGAWTLAAEPPPDAAHTLHVLHRTPEDGSLRWVPLGQVADSRLQPADAAAPLLREGRPVFASPASAPR